MFLCLVGVADTSISLLSCSILMNDLFCIFQGFTYLVGWKGYSADHNSWVEERDAGYVLKRVHTSLENNHVFDSTSNASDLISEYWQKNSKEQKAKKSLEKPKIAPKASRKSDTGAEPSSTSAVKKRGRTKSTKDGSDGADSEKEQPKTAKKPRKSTGATKLTTPADMDVDDEVGNMNN